MALAYEGHVTDLTERALALIGHEIGFPTVIGRPTEIRAAVIEVEESGVQELIYTPSGSDVARELRAFFAAAQLPDARGGR
jgi:5,10-methylenetetrahydromethanopterin reductase